MAEGKESEALTEDAMHFAVELIGITNPKLFYQMFSQIHKYKIYSFVYDEYSKLYEKDGVPYLSHRPYKRSQSVSPCAII